MYAIAFVLRLLEEWFNGLDSLFVQFIGIVFFLVGHCCWGQGEFGIARSLGLSSRLLMFFDFFGLLILVCDGVVGCFIFMCTCSVMVVCGYGD